MAPWFARSAARATPLAVVPSAVVPPAGVEGTPREAVSDDTLIALLPARDGAAQDALEALYQRYSGAVYGLGIRMLGDTTLAEHLVQETFLLVWRYAETYEPNRVRLGTWLLRLARNKAISERRAAACRPKVATPHPAGSEGQAEALGDVAGAEQVDLGADVPDLVWQGERQRLIRGALLALPPQQREAVELAYFGGLTHREIAVAQSAPPSTVKTRLALGLRKLAQLLEAKGLSSGAY